MTKRKIHRRTTNDQKSGGAHDTQIAAKTMNTITEIKLQDYTLTVNNGTITRTSSQHQDEQDDHFILTAQVYALSKTNLHSSIEFMSSETAQATAKKFEDVE